MSGVYVLVVPEMVTHLAACSPGELDALLDLLARCGVAGQEYDAARGVWVVRLGMAAAPGAYVAVIRDGTAWLEPERP